MTDLIDDQLETFYGSISQQPLPTRLENMTMTRFKKRAARRLFASLATGTLVMAVAVAVAVAGLAAHVDRTAPGSPASHGMTDQGTAAQVTSQPLPSGSLTTVTVTGAISGTMHVISTECSPGSPAAPGYAQGQPVHGQTPAAIEADGQLNGEEWSLIITQDNPSEPGAAAPYDATTASLGKSKLVSYGFYGPLGSGVTTFTASGIAIFDIDMTPGLGNGAPVNVVGQVVCP